MDGSSTPRQQHQQTPVLRLSNIHRSFDTTTISRRSSTSSLPTSPGLGLGPVQQYPNGGGGTTSSFGSNASSTASSSAAVHHPSFTNATTSNSGGVIQNPNQNHLSRRKSVRVVVEQPTMSVDLPTSFIGSGTSSGPGGGFIPSFPKTISMSGFDNERMSPLDNNNLPPSASSQQRRASVAATAAGATMSPSHNNANNTVEIPTNGSLTGTGTGTVEISAPRALSESQQRRRRSTILVQRRPSLAHSITGGLTSSSFRVGGATASFAASSPSLHATAVSRISLNQGVSAAGSAAAAATDQAPGASSSAVASASPSLTTSSTSTSTHQTPNLFLQRHQQQDVNVHHSNSNDHSSPHTFVPPPPVPQPPSQLLSPPRTPPSSLFARCYGGVYWFAQFLLNAGRLVGISSLLQLTRVAPFAAAFIVASQLWFSTASTPTNESHLATTKANLTAFAAAGIGWGMLNVLCFTPLAAAGEAVEVECLKEAPHHPNQGLHLRRGWIVSTGLCIVSYCLCHVMVWVAMAFVDDARVSTHQMLDQLQAFIRWSPLLTAAFAVASPLQKFLEIRQFQESPISEEMSSSASGAGGGHLYYSDLSVDGDDEQMMQMHIGNGDAHDGDGGGRGEGKQNELNLYTDDHRRQNDVHNMNATSGVGADDDDVTRMVGQHQQKQQLNSNLSRGSSSDSTSNSNISSHQRNKRHGSNKAGAVSASIRHLRLSSLWISQVASAIATPFFVWLIITTHDNAHNKGGSVSSSASVSASASASSNNTMHSGGQATKLPHAHPTTLLCYALALGRWVSVLVLVFFARSSRCRSFSQAYGRWGLALVCDRTDLRRFLSRTAASVKTHLLSRTAFDSLVFIVALCSSCRSTASSSSSNNISSISSSATTAATAITTHHGSYDDIGISGVGSNSSSNSSSFNMHMTLLPQQQQQLVLMEPVIIRVTAWVILWILFTCLYSVAVGVHFATVTVMKEALLETSLSLLIHTTHSTTTTTSHNKPHHEPSPSPLSSSVPPPPPPPPPPIVCYDQRIDTTTTDEANKVVDDVVATSVVPNKKTNPPPIPPPPPPPPPPPLSPSPGVGVMGLGSDDVGADGGEDPASYAARFIQRAALRITALCGVLFLLWVGAACLLYRSVGWSNLGDWNLLDLFFSTKTAAAAAAMTTTVSGVTGASATTAHHQSHPSTSMLSLLRLDVASAATVMSLALLGRSLGLFLQGVLDALKSCCPTTISTTTSQHTSHHQYQRHSRSRAQRGGGYSKGAVKNKSNNSACCHRSFLRQFLSLNHGPLLALGLSQWGVLVPLSLVSSALFRASLSGGVCTAVAFASWLFVLLLGGIIALAVPWGQLEPSLLVLEASDDDAEGGGDAGAGRGGYGVRCLEYDDDDDGDGEEDDDSDVLSIAEEEMSALTSM